MPLRIISPALGGKTLFANVESFQMKPQHQKPGVSHPVTSGSVRGILLNSLRRFSQRSSINNPPSKWQDKTRQFDNTIKAVMCDRTHNLVQGPELALLASVSPEVRPAARRWISIPVEELLVSHPKQMSRSIMMRMHTPELNRRLTLRQG
jgi:hypothetical protein